MKLVMLTLALMVTIGLAGCQFGTGQNLDQSSPKTEQDPEQETV